MSSSIYHAAEEALIQLEQGHITETQVRLNSIIAAQSMLKIRTDVLDYAGSTGVSPLKEDVFVYRKVDKVVRCFAAIAARKHIRINLTGNSFNGSNGPDVFEILPYIIIDNAIKYSPSNNDIEVSVREEGDSIILSVTSLGPLLEQGELEKIFERGIRGKYAIESGVAGSGAGLYLAKRLVEEFNGEINVSLSGLCTIGSQRMADINFLVRVPISNAQIEQKSYPLRRQPPV